MMLTTAPKVVITEPNLCGYLTSLYQLLRLHLPLFRRGASPKRGYACRLIGVNACHVHHSKFFPGERASEVHPPYHVHFYPEPLSQSNTTRLS